MSGRRASGAAHAHTTLEPTARALGWLCVHPDREHLAIKMWGRPIEAEALCDVLDALAPRTRFVAADLRALVVTSERDLGRLGQALSSLLAHVQISGAELMLLRGRGLGGVIVTGVLAAFADLSSLRLPVDALDALTGLSPRRQRIVRALFGPLDASDVADTPLVEDADLRNVRAFLREELHTRTLADVARALGLSVRSLQRKLARRGTTFSRELQHARVDAAKGLLLSSDDKIETIAERVGCCSSQHLGRIFKRHARETPQAFRRRHG